VTILIKRLNNQGTCKGKCLAVDTSDALNAIPLFAQVFDQLQQEPLGHMLKVHGRQKALFYSAAALFIARLLNPDILD
jgi:hypothetical protein